MKEHNTYLSFISMVLLLLFLSTDLPFAQNNIAAGVLSSGGERQSSAGNTIIGTVGQVSIDIITSAGNKIQPGFWNVYNNDAAVDVKREEYLPILYKLEQNYPNPFNPSTIIKFSVPEKCHVSVKVYDIIGSTLVTLVNEELDAGRYQRIFNAAGYSSGVYIYRMEAGKYISTRKMLLIK